MLVLRYAGFAPEATDPMVDAAPAATFHVDIASASLDAPGDSLLPHPGGIGRGVNTYRPGFYSPSGDVVYAVDVRTIGWFLKWALGGYVFTVEPGDSGTANVAVTAAPTTLTDTRETWTVNQWAGALLTCGGSTARVTSNTATVLTFTGGWTGAEPADGLAWTLVMNNTHEIWTSEDSDLDPFVTRLGKDHFEHIFRGCIIGALSIEVSDGYVMATMSVVSRKDELTTIQAVANLLLPDEYPLVFHDVTASFNGVDRSAKIRGFTLNIDNGVDAEAGRRIGTRFPTRLRAYERTITVDMENAFDDDDELVRFWGGALGPAALGPTEFAMAFDLDAGGEGNVVLSLPRCAYTSLSQQPSGRTEITQSGAIQAFMADHTLADGITDIRSELLATITSAVGDMEP